MWCTRCTHEFRMPNLRSGLPKPALLAFQTYALGFPNRCSGSLKPTLWVSQTYAPSLPNLRSESPKPMLSECSHSLGRLSQAVGQMSQAVGIFWELLFFASLRHRAGTGPAPTLGIHR